MLEVSPYLILVLDCIGGTLLQFQCVFEVFLGVDLVAVLVLQHEGEITYYPEKGGETAGVLPLAAGLGLDVLREVDDQVQGVEGVLVDAAHRIIDEERTKQQ